MATIYHMNGAVAAEGLQSSLVCDEAVTLARRIARAKGRSVIVVDAPAREAYRITPAGHRWRVPKNWFADWDQDFVPDWVG